MFIRQDNTLKWNWIGVGALITLALVALGIFGMDKVFYNLIHGTNCNQWTIGGGWLCYLCIFIGKMFSAKMWLGVFGLAVIVFFVYKAFTNEWDFRYAFIKIKNSYVFYVFMSVFLAVATTGILKFLIGRSRPMLYEALGNTFFVPGVWEHTFNSMPSGHTAASFAGLVMIGMLLPKIKWATWTLAILVGASRLYVGAHWMGDVLLGAFIGMVSADIVKAILKKINAR